MKLITLSLTIGMALLLSRASAVPLPAIADDTEQRLSDVTATNAVLARTLDNWLTNGARRSVDSVHGAIVSRGRSPEEVPVFSIANREFSLTMTTDGKSVVSFLDRVFINRQPQKVTQRTRMDQSSPELSAVVPRLMVTANLPNVGDFEEQIAAGVKFNYTRDLAYWNANLVREWNGFRVPSDRINIMVDDITGLVVNFRDFRIGYRFDSLNEQRVSDKDAETTARAEVLRRVQLYQPQLLEPVISLEGRAELQVDYFRIDALEQAASEEVKRAIKRDLQQWQTHWYPRLAFKLFFIVRGRSSDAKGTPVVVSEFVYVDATTGELLPVNVRR